MFLLWCLSSFLELYLKCSLFTMHYIDKKTATETLSKSVLVWNDVNWQIYERFHFSIPFPHFLPPPFPPAHKWRSSWCAFAKAHITKQACCPHFCAKFRLFPAVKMDQNHARWLKPTLAGTYVTGYEVRGRGVPSFSCHTCQQNWRSRSLRRSKKKLK